MNMRSTCLRGCLSIVLALAAALAAPAAALVLAPDVDTTLAPPDDRGWDYVGQRGNASAVYLGDRWVLTAFHVRSGKCHADGADLFEGARRGDSDRKPARFRPVAVYRPADVPLDGRPWSGTADDQSGTTSRFFGSHADWLWQDTCRRPHVMERR